MVSSPVSVFSLQLVFFRKVTLIWAVVLQTQQVRCETVLVVIYARITFIGT